MHVRIPSVHILFEILRMLRHVVRLIKTGEMIQKLGEGGGRRVHNAERTFNLTESPEMIKILIFIQLERISNSTISLEHNNTVIMVDQMTIKNLIIFM